MPITRPSYRGLILFLAVGGLSVLLAGSAWSFEILEPDEQGQFKSGQTVTAKVDLGKDTGVVKVRYYWYSEHAEALVQADEPAPQSSDQSSLSTSQRALEEERATGQQIVARPALVSTAENDPPFGGKLTIPHEAVGTIRLLAVAEISRGRLGIQTSFDEILVKAEPPSELASIDFETEKPLKLGRIGQAASYEQVDFRGKTIELPIVGLFADGITRSLSSPSTGTTITSSNPAVIKVESYGLLRLTGSGRTTLTVKNRGKEALLEVISALSDEPNEPPIAEAGENRTVKAGRKVELNGLKSRDPEGEALFYYWSQVRGSKVPLLDLNMPRASFVAPTVSEPRLFRFKLRVYDKLGADSLPAFVDVTVEP
ncbi:MAG: hypothetical protein AB7G48_05560 [Nitrospiraceae bacterium]